MKIKEIKKSDIWILWLWREGKSTLRFLLNAGVKNFTLFDEDAEKMYEMMKYFIDEEVHLDFEVKKEDNCYKGKIKITYKQKKRTIKFYFWDFNTKFFEDYDAIIKTPWISPYKEKYEPYRNKFTSQTRIFTENYKGKVIGITGTKGKSTTSTLIYLALKEAGYKVRLVWNIWNPVLDEINLLEKHQYDYVVYEMSSYMLEDGSPKNYISILNNIYECHIDWHKTFENYKKAKSNILGSAKYALINYDFKDFDEIKSANKNIVFHYWSNGDYSYHNNAFFKGSKKVMPDTGILIEGEHNRKNITAVIGVLDIILKKDLKKIEKVLTKVLSSFQWLPHRIEKVGVFNEITFIDDAIGSTPESTLEAMKTFWDEIWTIFLGGYDSGFKFDGLEKKLKELKIQNIIFFPDTGYKIFKHLTENIEEDKETTIEVAGDYKPTIIKTRSMKKWVQFAYKHTNKGKIALLSCASPSYSLWKNYEVKWDLFQEEVKKEAKTA